MKKKLWFVFGILVVVLALLLVVLYLDTMPVQAGQAHIMYMPMVLSHGGMVLKVKLSLDVPDTITIPEIVTPVPPDDTIIPNVDPEPTPTPEPTPEPVIDEDPPYRWRVNIQNPDVPLEEPGQHNRP